MATLRDRDRVPKNESATNHPLCPIILELLSFFPSFTGLGTRNIPSFDDLRKPQKCLNEISQHLLPEPKG